jgi:hypothetical protein
VPDDSGNARGPLAAAPQRRPPAVGMRCAALPAPPTLTEASLPPRSQAAPAGLRHRVRALMSTGRRGDAIALREIREAEADRSLQVCAGRRAHLVRRVFRS